MARIILLNGPGSVGKSTVARALQSISNKPLLHVAMDMFIEMLPDHLQNAPETFQFRTGEVDGRPVTEVTTGAAGAALMRAMRDAVAALATAGFDLVVDDVWLAGEPADYRRLLAGHRIWRIGLTAPLAVLEGRERARGDRLPGLSRAQIDLVHCGNRYDLFLDTGVLMPDEIARQIAGTIGLAT